MMEMELFRKLRRHFGIRTVVVGALFFGIVGGFFDISFEKSSWFFALLLGIGLLNSTFGIVIEEMKAIDWKILVWAITIGVTVKAAIIGAAMYCLTGELRFFVIAVTVAQMDPLSVGALIGKSRLSVRADNLLRAWAALDDPVTVLMTIVLFVVARLTHTDLGLSFDSVQISTLGSFGTYAVQNVAFMTMIVFFWQLAYSKSATKTYTYKLALTLAFMVGGIVVGSTWFWMFGIALVGIFLRPDDVQVSERVQRILEIATNVAFALAGVIIGGLLVIHGIDPLPGIALGVCAFASQAIVVWSLLPSRRKMDRRDRLYLAGGHQNGVTACLLALATGTVPIVVPAIVVTHLLHFAWNAVLDRRYA
jgi:NhaP-type Na+/H+ or K+/H+ antiporter